MADLKADLLEEIALEGLDGITISGLWVRLKDRPNFPLTLDDGSRSYIWRGVLGLRDVEFYKLPEPRPGLVAYNRLHYIDPDTRHFIESDVKAEDIYPPCIINDNGVLGSCSTYTTRVNITDDVRKPGANLSLAEAVEMYGETLVIVGTPDLRRRTLIGTENDPNFVFNAPNYCVLERVGRSRYSGESSVGHNSLNDISDGPKSISIFYHIKKLNKLKVLRSQQLVMVKHNPYAKVSCRLYHLNRFYQLIGNPLQLRLQKLVNYLLAQPDHMFLVSKCKEYMKIFDKEFKKLTSIANKDGNRLFQYLDVPYRHVYPDATSKQYMSKNYQKEKSLRLLKLLRNPRASADAADFSDSDDNIDDDEEAEDVGDNFQMDFKHAYDRPLLMQVYQLVQRTGSRGASQQEIQRAIRVDRLVIRRFVKSLLRIGLVKGIMKDRGRQKFMMYIAKDCAPGNEFNQRVKQGIQKFASFGHKKNVLTPPTIQLYDEPMTEDRARRIKNELLSADPGMDAPAKDKPLQQPGADYTVSYEERKVERSGNEKFGLQRFALTDVHIRRANWVIEVVRATRMVEQFRCLKLIRFREESLKTSYKMDSKSMNRLVSALVEEHKIRCLITTQSMGMKEKQTRYLLDLDLSIDSDLVKRAVEQAKFKYFSVTKEELCKAKKAALAEATAAKAGADTDANTSATITFSHLHKKKLSGDIPETAKASIRRHFEYRRRLSQKAPPMKYNRKAGMSYGLLPKMIRCEATHQYLFYLCYDTHGRDLVPMETSPVAQQEVKAATQEGDRVDLHAVLWPADIEKKADSVDTPKVEDMGWNEKEPPMYSDEMSWKRYLPPLPVHQGYPAGWCLVSDCLLNLPVRLFCQLVNVCYDIDGLHAILRHPYRGFYPIAHLPFKISQQLLHSRKYVSSFLDGCSYMAEMGLLSFGSCKDKDKDHMFVYLHKKASLLDTRDSLPGYNKTQVPEGITTFPRKRFTFTDTKSVEPYWQDMQIIGLGSNLGSKMMAAKNCDDTVTFEEVSIADAGSSRNPDTVVDEGLIPGDGRGGAGLDSRLFSHSSKNWCYDRQTNVEMDKYKLSCRDIQPPELAVVKSTKVVGTPRGSKKLILSDGKGDKPVVIRKTRNVKGNPGGKGVKRVLSSVEGTSLRKRPIRKLKYAEFTQPKKVYYHKKPFERGDDLDRLIYASKTQQRVQWSTKEDSVLLMCQIASCIMDPGRKLIVVKYTVVRDIVHEKCPGISEGKSSLACSRRLKFALKNPQTEQNVSLFLEEALQDKYILDEFATKMYVGTDALTIQSFTVLVNYLLDKFQSMDIRKSQLPQKVSDLAGYTLEAVGKLKPKKIFRDVQSQVDICKDVLRNILHSSALLQDKTGRNHEMFKLLTQYPDSLLSAVIRELRMDGLLVIQKQRNKRVDSKLHAGVGLRNFKVSQRYMYNYKHRYLSDLFGDSAELVQQLYEAGRSGAGGRVALDFHPKGAQSSLLIPLLLQDVIDFKVTLPDELVLVDMDGFYNFPWGRGKIGIRDGEKAVQASDAQSRIDKCFNKDLLPQPGPSEEDEPRPSTSETVASSISEVVRDEEAMETESTVMESSSGNLDKDDSAGSTSSFNPLPIDIFLKINRKSTTYLFFST